MSVGERQPNTKRASFNNYSALDEALNLSFLNYEVMS